ncbi:RNA polymerase sigma factor [Flavihumibacter fluvii]|uniref:RNA polymerase sigma factor n=1 Tax=Flavihumibacter fluvii TaxID=2838157 RepID=UPI001BDEE0A8|nr:sigma-70 family RNA polymerase sigma factor [Flavihumibacter fluvii]ULQ53437.1 sigma-70 family RNA polymerase sigma factor [Flavihumibacter fluvii]
MSLSQGTEDTLPSLVSGCALLNRASQKQFYAQFYGYAFSTCHRYVSKEEEIIEVVNDGFLKIFREISHFQPMYASFENSLMGWIRRIFINTAIDHVRKEKNRMLFTHDQHEAIDNVSVPAAGLERLSHKELLELITKLTPAYRMVFNLYVIDGYTHEEISEILGIAVGTSKSNLAKARFNLQKMILNKQTQLLIHEQRAI